MRALPLLLLVMACQVTATEPENEIACSLKAFDFLVGQPASAIPDQGLPSSTRIIPLGSMVTLDYSPERLNIYLDKNERVDRISCG